MRINLVRTEQIKELSAEFWGIINFENNIKGIYNFLNLSELGISLMTLSHWLVFPEDIAPDIRNMIRTKLLHRHAETTYYSDFIYPDMNEEEEEIHNKTIELIHFKMHAKHASLNRFYFIYKLPIKAFKNLLSRMLENGNLDNETSLQFYRKYSKMMERGEFDGRQ
ncbi:hypothetical protein [Peribacillus loiseleuriae]|uniref:hypothetical protein n=1 Tax=Peribacillus loiseleuriae TaxID=1679170 RepID=UPI003CFD7461